MRLLFPKGTVVGGTNTIRFRFNQTDGVASGYRMLAWNFLSDGGRMILPPDDFEEDSPESWTPPLADAASIEAGRELWHSAALVASSLPNSPSELVQGDRACAVRGPLPRKRRHFEVNAIAAEASPHVPALHTRGRVQLDC